MRLKETESSGYEPIKILDQVAVQIEKNGLPRIYKIGSKCWGPAKNEKLGATMELIPSCEVTGFENDGKQITAVKVSYTDGSFKTIALERFKDLQRAGSKQTL